MTPNNVLITGGTGFLGRSLVRHFLRLGTERICIYSRGEAAQAAFRAELGDPYSCRWFIGDVRDPDRLRLAMGGRATQPRMDAVINAAALKRVEVGEYNPTEMVKTNVEGVQNLIWAAIEAGADRVVQVSTDKAVEPLNTYGASKLLAEKLVLGANSLSPPGGTTFAVVRYGNVAGSTGSIIPIWRQALAEKGTLIVNHPDATRFWLTVDDAVSLVALALHALPGALLVPELPAYRLGTLACAMLPEAAPGEDPPDPVPIKILRKLGAGEKMHESLLGTYEPGGPRTSDAAPQLTEQDLRAALKMI